MQKETDWLILPDGSGIKPSKIESCYWDKITSWEAGCYGTRPVFIIEAIGTSRPVRFFVETADDTARVLADWMIGDYPADEIDSRKWPCMIEARRTRALQQTARLNEREKKRNRQKQWWADLWRNLKCA